MKIDRKKTILVIALLALGFLLGRSCTHRDHRSSTIDHQDEAAVDFWTCSMHPQVQQPEPGKCPICAMDIIPVTKGGSDEPLGERQIRLSPTAQKLAEVEVAEVRRDFVTATIRLAGKVEYDERRIADIAARVPGRLDRLYVDYTGIKVNKGDHLVYLYSPELLAAQEELIQARRTSRELDPEKQTLIAQRMRSTVEASRDKLRLLGLTADQIATIEESGQPSDHITIYAPVSGIVIEKHALEGAYVQTGTKVYTIADLSQVWIKLDAYESDLQWLHYGQSVAFETQAYPGEVFHGTIAFIDPVLNPKTRSVKVRVNVANDDLRLKPEMFVSALVKSRIASGGKVMDPSLAGKWICPMHPEIVKDQADTCDICEMDLVSAESLGYASAQQDEAPLVIPASAPLITGKRSVVYVAVADRPGIYEGREVVLGARAGDNYIVKDGLVEGEQVVVNGAFKIDSAIQIQAKPSMMNPGGGGPVPGHQHGGRDAQGHAPSAPEQTTLEVPKAFQHAAGEIVAPYLKIQAALSTDDVDSAQKAASNLVNMIEAIDSSTLAGHAVHVWSEVRTHLLGHSQSIRDGSDIAEARENFQPLSRALASVVTRFRPHIDDKLFVLYCPMAFDDEGGDWIQNHEDVLNPYFGASMLKCGSVKEQLPVGVHDHE